MIYRPFDINEYWYGVPLMFTDKMLLFAMWALLAAYEDMFLNVNRLPDTFSHKVNKLVWYPYTSKQD